MVWINRIKELLGVKSVRPYEFNEEKQDTLVLTPEQKIENAVAVSPVTVKPKKSTTKKPKRETRKSLDKLTKKAIDDLALERFGTELDRRKTKADMIEDFMSAQKKAK